MLDIYDADGFIDRSRVLDRLREALEGARTLGFTDGNELRRKLADLLDEVAEGFTSNPLDAPTAVVEGINMCRPAWSATKPLCVEDYT